MDSLGEHSSDFDVDSSAEVSASEDVASAIGTDERRMHVRAYNYWVALLDGRDFPSIEDLEPSDVRDFSDNSVLLDFTCGRDNPAMPYIGAAIREECGLSDDTRTIDDVPSRSLLSRLTDHYLQIIANRAPIGFEAEFANQREETICYRGILMPFSSDGDTIDFIYGVINWKTVGGSEAEQAEGAIAPDSEPTHDFVEEPLELTDQFATEDEPELESMTVLESFDSEEAVAVGEPELDPEEQAEPEVLELDDEFEAEAEFDPPPVHPDFIENMVPLGDIEATLNAEQQVDPAPEEVLELVEVVPHFEPVPEQADTPVVHFSWEDGPLADEEAGELPHVELDPDAGLADRLWAARETADAVKAGEGRTRSALYRALSLAYDFALSAEENPDEYAELLEESGVKAQARAPMTPIVKLVFGIDYDKARLTEFAAALSYAFRRETEVGCFQDLIEKQPGGLKALVAAEREARRPGPKADTKAEIGRARLRKAPTISLSDVPAEEEFALVLTRRGSDGQHEAVAIVEDEALVERAIRGVA